MPCCLSPQRINNNTEPAIAHLAKQWVGVLPLDGAPSFLFNCSEALLCVVFPAAWAFLSRPLDSLVGRRSPLTSSCGGGASGIDQKTQCPVHRVGIGECLRQIWLDQHQVCSSHSPLVVFAANAAFELRQVILRPKLVIDFLC